MAIINPTWEQIFSSNATYDKQLKLDFGEGLILGNSNIVSESMELKESICSQSSLVLGSCEASSFKIRLFNNEEPDLTKRSLDVKLFVIDSQTQEPIYFDVGKYRVFSDTPTGDRLYHDIVAYDALYDIMNTDYYEWYTEFLTDVGKTYTIKQLRDAFFLELGIQQVSTSLVNDSQTMNANGDIQQLLGKDILNAICELNGVFGHLNREGKFVYILPDESTVDKNYEYYRQGTVDYNKYKFHQITQISVTNNVTTGIAGETGNNYDIGSSWLTINLDGTRLENIAANILSVVDGIVYWPFKAKTYGDLCTEVGDCITIPTSNFTIKSFVFERTCTGLQALADSFEAKGDTFLPTTSTSARITKLEQQVMNIDSVINEVTNRIVTFTNDEDVDIPANTWTPIARSSMAVNAETSLLVHGVAKIYLDLDGLVKFRYHIMNKGYEAFVHEIYMHEDVDTATLFYVLIPPVNDPTRLTVEVNTGNATGKIYKGDFHGAYTGSHIVVEGWDGILDAEEEITAILGNGGFIVTGITDNVDFDWKDVEFVNASDIISAVLGNGGFVVSGVTDQPNVYTQKDIYNIVSEDKTYRLVSEDDNYYFESEE